MSFPGLPGTGRGGSAAGMSDQEAAMVKAVSILDLQSGSCAILLLTLFGIDASRYGELPSEEHNIWRHGIRPWRHVWTFHVQCTLSTYGRAQAIKGDVDKWDAR